MYKSGLHISIQLKQGFVHPPALDDLILCIRCIILSTLSFKLVRDKCSDKYNKEAIILWQRTAECDTLHSETFISNRFVLYTRAAAPQPPQCRGQSMSTLVADSVVVAISTAADCAKTKSMCGIICILHTTPW